MPTPEQEHEFLLADFEHVADSLLQNEAEGERRVTLFTGLVASAMGAVAFAAQVQGLDWPRLFVGVAEALIALGGLTILRLHRRNEVTNHYKEVLQQMRCVGAPILSRDYRELFGSKKKAAKKSSRLWWHGGHITTVWAIIIGLGVAAVVVGNLQLKTTESAHASSP